MKRLSTVVLATLAVTAATGCGGGDTTAPNLGRSATTVPTADRYLVVFSQTQGLPTGFAGQVAKLGGTVELSLDKLGAAVVTGLSSQGATKLLATSGVMSVDADPVIDIAPAAVRYTELSSVTPSSQAHPENALLYGAQWNMQTIQAKPAWQAGFLGSPAVTVAILDTGIDPSNPDLGGHIDATRSVSLLPADDKVVQDTFPGKPLYTDLDGHGTNVASQVVSNGLYLAGVTSRTTLMAVKVCSIFGGCPFSTVAAGVTYAADHGADVINMSLGGGFFKGYNDPELSCHGCASLVNRFINYANRAGVTIVVAAGNSAIDVDHDGNYYSTYCDSPHVICVSSTGPASVAGPGPYADIDAPALYTNYGRSGISVAGPGGGITVVRDTIVDGGWVYSLCSRTSLVYDKKTKTLSKTICSTNPSSLFLSGYVGTSQASPHVAGLAALIVSRFGRGPGTVKSILESSADDLGYSGTDPYYGKGRINVARAMGL